MKPILFNSDMVRAILSGKKTQTRRLVHPAHIAALQYPARLAHPEMTDLDYLNRYASAKYYVGDILYVRETWGDYRESSGCYYTLYRADYPEGAKTYKAGEDEFGKEIICDLPEWHPSIHMPKEDARIFLRVTHNIVEKLQDITTDGAKREGAETAEWDELQEEAGVAGLPTCTLREFFGHHIWDRTLRGEENYKKYGWDANPFVWVHTFERISYEEALEGSL